MEDVMELIESAAAEHHWLIPTVIGLILLAIPVILLRYKSNKEMKKVKEAMKDPVAPTVVQKPSPPAVVAPVSTDETSSSDDSSTSSSDDGNDYPGPGDQGPTPDYGRGY